MFWLVSNEIQMNSNFEPANYSRIWLFKKPNAFESQYQERKGSTILF